MSDILTTHWRALWLTLAAIAIVLLAAPVAQAADYHLYFGDLHTHTSYSDGEGTPTEAFAAAKAARADFMATTDHHYQLNAWEWADTIAAAAAATDDSFVAIAAYEYHMPGIGEINIYAAEDMPRGIVGHGTTKNGAPDHRPRENALSFVYDWIVANDAIGHWNHPNYYVGDRWGDFLDYAEQTADRDAGMCLLEIFNKEIQEASYAMALDAGWHALPSSNSDTHEANWISGEEVRTVLLAPELTREALFEAMRERRGYGTRDRNLRVDFTVDGATIGSHTLPGAAHVVAVSVENPSDADGEPADPSEDVTLLELVSDGGEVVGSYQPAEGNTATWSTTVPGGCSYIYLRVWTAGEFEIAGPTAWTAPVWMTP
ncbi:MAG TPA: CehA/McbA family metallohydrolase [Thermoleophilia bacterium]|nr:CehA/McbA family metallohydrolase [Thermoleophilia bacterium]